MAEYSTRSAASVLVVVLVTGSIKVFRLMKIETEFARSVFSTTVKGSSRILNHKRKLWQLRSGSVDFVLIFFHQPQGAEGLSSVENEC